jgi:crotonobetainyl-CoA:carnitine CoA-transferase CaiB-like acyl-CoA transferase
MNDQLAALQDIRIIDFSHVFQGPVATQLLADYGADVIKVERPGSGDWSRAWGPFVDGVSMPYASLNRNKRSLAINLKDPEGKAIILELVKSADVLVHNFRSAVMEKLGFGYEDLKAINPRLIYAASSGWGDSGPYVERGRGGHDLMARAEAGLFYQPDPATPPEPAGISADYPAGLMLAQGILLALFARTHTGCGQLVTTDLFSVAFHANTWSAAQELNQHRNLENVGIGATEAAINKSFKTADGWIEISPVFSDNALRDVSTALGIGDLSLDPRFATPQEQLVNQDAMNAALATQFVNRTTDEWIAELEPRGVLCAKVRTFAQAADDPQLEVNNMVVNMEHPSAGSLRLLGTPARLHHTPPALRIPPAALGEHTRDILGELGYTPEQIDNLAHKGVVDS